MNGEELWRQLAQVTGLEFSSTSRTGNGWSGQGSGTVEVLSPEKGVLVFKEAGSWTQNGGREIRSRNTFRWTRLDATLRLEHLRFGAANLVFLFDLAPGEDESWREVEPHLCREDFYRATLWLQDETLYLEWNVFGPRHDETMSYVYQ